MRLHPYEFENCWSEFCLYTLPHCDVPVCLFASLTLSSMSASALRVGFCTYGAHNCSFALARFSKPYTFTYLWRSVPCAFSFLCCDLPKHGMSTCTATNIICFRVLSEFQVDFHVHWAPALSRAIIDPLCCQADMALQGHCGCRLQLDRSNPPLVSSSQQTLLTTPSWHFLFVKFLRKAKWQPQNSF